MFEITGDDISLLDDEDLRIVVGRLCEAELRRQGHPVSHVTWGGNQTAPDGGLDVRVALPAGTEIEGFIPRAETGFQVKKPDMPRQAIIDEMKPNGVVRPVIGDLARASGSYIIISSTGSTADFALQNRKDAMAEAVKDIAEAAQLTLDFYDRNRIATWVRDHAGLIPWVRSLIGKSVPGWQSFGSWSRVPGGVDATYLVDDHARIKTGDTDEGDGLSVADGINRLREVLRIPGKVVRLVGMSGVGKTRLCEVLFDTTVGANNLDPSLAIYTNTAEEPSPPPVGLASDLIANRTRAILVVDNCTPELHRQLGEVSRVANSTISLITIEYDIRDDQPEDTNVFVLGSSSPELIEKLIQHRYPELSQVDARTIAEFAGGNARVALALAATVGKAETITGLSDAELFNRLFQQRHPYDPDLLLIAQACSLVYSFEGTKTTGKQAELPILAGLVGKSAQDAYPLVAELKRRDLLQTRTEWRAVLPHAIANRLAALALENIPLDTVKDALVINAPARLLRSFSRRLGYLDASDNAQEIVKGWLAPNGMLADVTNLNEHHLAVLANVAPVAPKATLAAIERALHNADMTTFKQTNHLKRLLRSLAYDPALFECAISILAKLASQRDTDGEVDREALGIFKSLFHIYLSGTLAPVELRLAMVQPLLSSTNAAKQDLGIEALRAMMKTSDFTSFFGFEFGARSRDFGFQPRTKREIHDWHDAVMAVAGPLALSKAPVAPHVRKCIAKAFRGLWTNGGQANSLEDLAKQIAKEGFWRDGWTAVHKTRIYEGMNMPSDAFARLKTLEKLLQPEDLVDKVRAVVLSSEGSVNLDIHDDDGTGGGKARMTATIEHLGRELAVDEEVFEGLLPALIRGDHKTQWLGRGLASAAKNPHEVWQSITTELATVDKGATTTALMRGFLSGMQRRNATLTNVLLDEALEQPATIPYFVQLQTSVTIGEAGIRRLHQALKSEKTPTSQFYALASGTASDEIPGPAFRDIVMAIASRPDGDLVALEILHMRIFSDQTEKRELAPELLETGRELLKDYQFRDRTGQMGAEDQELGRIVQVSLKSDDSIPLVQQLVRKMMVAINDRAISVHDYDDLLDGLVRVHPIVVLDQMFSGDIDEREKAVNVFAKMRTFGRNLLGNVPEKTLLEWCAGDPAVRYPIIAASATLFERPAKDQPHEWRSLASKLLAASPDPVAVLKKIATQLKPTDSRGSLATQLESLLKLFEKLPVGQELDVAEAFKNIKTALETNILTERKIEAEDDRMQSGRFED